MKRRIVKIDADKCSGCGLCAKACHEGAIGMVNGKARLLRDDYCDGLGDCLPVCPENAITFEEREAAAYDEAAVKANKTGVNSGCAGARPSEISAERESASMLRQWPVQIKLCPVNAPYFDGAGLLIAADCTAYAYAGFHNKFMDGRITLVGCPKLDAVDYADKLSEIFKANDISDITVARMQVPCCGGLENAVKRAIAESGKEIPLSVVTISTDGRIVKEV